MTVIEEPKTSKIHQLIGGGSEQTSTSTARSLAVNLISALLVIFSIFSSKVPFVVKDKPKIILLAAPN